MAKPIICGKQFQTGQMATMLTIASSTVGKKVILFFFFWSIREYQYIWHPLSSSKGFAFYPTLQVDLVKFLVLLIFYHFLSSTTKKVLNDTISEVLISSSNLGKVPISKNNFLKKSLFRNGD